MPCLLYLTALYRGWTYARRVDFAPDPSGGQGGIPGKGFRGAPLRNIVKSVGMTTGAFYGYYKSKEELFEALVGEPHDYLIGRFKNAQQEFAQLPHEQQPEVMGDISGLCMLRYVPLCLCAFGGM